MRRRLSADEAALWARVAGTIAPMHPKLARREDHLPAPSQHKVLVKLPAPNAARPAMAAPAPIAKERPLNSRTLDASWDRKLGQGLIAPDFTLDLHGHTLDSAHARLDHGLALALAQGARLVLLIAGRPRPVDDRNHRGERRGAIRAKFLDWLTLGSHASRIAAIRPAHPRHGGAGAVYIVLRRAR